jgi:hypothetical protein
MIKNNELRRLPKEEVLDQLFWHLSRWTELPNQNPSVRIACVPAIVQRWDLRIQRMVLIFNFVIHLPFLLPPTLLLLHGHHYDFVAGIATVHPLLWDCDNQPH